MKPLFLLPGLLATLQAAYLPVFSVGTQNNSNSDFSQETGIAEPAPGSPTLLDDHYYTAGDYVLSGSPVTLSADEALANFERAFSSWDLENNVYFNLDGTEINPDGLVRFTINFLSSGSGTVSHPNHTIVFRINGNTIHTSTVLTGYETIVAVVPSSGLGLVNGANSLEMVRTSGTASSWINIDNLVLEVDPTALQDIDGDGLPRHWEEDHQLSDNNPADATLDHDGDTLTALQEFSAGTHPHLADTDQDGLTDQLELSTDPLIPDSDGDGLSDGEETNAGTNPILTDTDSDGAPDPWEFATGFDPGDNTSTPPAWAGAIGINFRSGEQTDRGTWPDIFPNGLVPQMHWNQTEPLRHWGVPAGDPLLTGDLSDIAGPTSGALVNSAGATTAVTLSFTFDGCWTTSNHGSPAADLFNGYLLTDDAFPASITLGGIPFSTYDLYLYVGADYLGPVGRVRLNADSGTDQFVRPNTAAPFSEFVEYRESAGPNVPLYNVVRFTGLTGTTQLVELIRAIDTTGICGIQIVDTSLDLDGDLIPDYWEIRHQTDFTTANAGADSDGDTLTNAQEFAAGTDPGEADSDGDGLDDAAELAASTDPLYADSDDDGLSDYDELNHVFPTNPLVGDSDGDGHSDKEEWELGTDPNAMGTVLPPVPTYPGANALHWEINNVQIVRDHTVPISTGGGEDRVLLALSAININEPNWRNLDFRLVERDGVLGYYFVSINPGAFALGGSDIWRSSFSPDLTIPLGFSGVGPRDISDPLTFRLEASDPGGTNSWTLTWTIINEHTATTVATLTETGATAAASITAQSAVWGADTDTPGHAGVNPGNGVSVYFSPTPLETLPAFSDWADDDNDGMPNWWETSFGLNPNDPADAGLNGDSDTLTNLEEFLHGTSPLLSDSDSDLVADDVEVSGFSDPSVITSAPPFFSTLPDLSPDRDSNGLSDVWEARYLVSGLLPGDDTDGDGMSNLAEDFAGTDPLDPFSNLHFQATDYASPGNVSLSWPRIEGKLQELLTSTDTTNWFLHPSPPVANGDSLTLTSPTSGTEFFSNTARDLFTDSDSLSDWAETVLGSSATSANSLGRAVPHDSNGDGTPDVTLSGDDAAYAARFGNRPALSAGVPPATPTRVDAARLLMQASFGPTLTEIENVRAMGLDGWLNDQMNNKPPTYHEPYVLDIIADFNGPRTDLNYAYDEMNDFIHGNNVQTAFARAAISGEDQLRQRVAYALSQIIVVSRRDANLAGNLRGLTNFYDLLVKHAFGNFEDLMLEVTFHPTMGRYLSHVGNQPPDPSINRYPDENYAREIMQLFMIGLWELNPDGTRKVDGAGAFIPTYSNAEITQLARVMTGMWFGGNRWGSGGWQDIDYALPMEMHADHHDFDAKVLLNGFVIPARAQTHANAVQDVRDAVRCLFEHPNCPPFISRALIQFLVTSNPSPEYVGRVSAVFADNGSGTRGDLGAVVAAILSDPEARDPAVAASETFGIVREPVLRTIHLARLTDLNRSGEILWWDWDNFYDQSFQAPLYAPTVFNFYRPDYQAPGILTAEGLAGPALQITNSYTAVSFPNALWDIANSGFMLYSNYHFPPDYGPFLDFAQDHDALLDYVNLVACAGNMSANSRGIIKSALDATDPGDDVGRTRLALYLALMAPEGAVQR